MYANRIDERVRTLYFMCGYAGHCERQGRHVFGVEDKFLNKIGASYRKLSLRW